MAKHEVMHAMGCPATLGTGRNGVCECGGYVNRREVAEALRGPHAPGTYPSQSNYAVAQAFGEFFDREFGKPKEER